jgi:hypothetical protein
MKSRRGVEVGLQPVVVHVAEHRGHDEQAQEERQTGEDLVGRRLLQAERVARQAEHDQDLGEARGRQQDRGQQ